MSRSVEERVRAVRRLLGAARAVYEARGTLVAAIVESTGLSPQGVELGFSCLEREATDGELRALVGAAGDAPRVHVILSANVFVAPLRALALARAASDAVTVRPSPRDPTLARALVAAVDDRGFACTDVREPPTWREGEIHIYGRDETIAAVRSEVAPSLRVRGHGAGLGLAILTRAAPLEECAEGLARDVTLFDQRGCLSPRIAFVEGGVDRAAAFAVALHEALGAWEARVPRGELTTEERVLSRQWRDAFSFAERLRQGTGHAVGLARTSAELVVGPPGRHLCVVAATRLEDAAPALRALAPFVVAIGTDDVPRARALGPKHARVGPLGRMHSPPLDGPVDGRNH